MGFVLFIQVYSKGSTLQSEVIFLLSHTCFSFTALLKKRKTWSSALQHQG